MRSTLNDCNQVILSDANPAYCWQALNTIVANYGWYEATLKNGVNEQCQIKINMTHIFNAVSMTVDLIVKF